MHASIFNRTHHANPHCSTLYTIDYDHIWPMSYVAQPFIPSKSLLGIEERSGVSFVF